MSIIDHILDFFGLYCHPSMALPIPTKQRHERQKPSPIPSNITFDGSGKAFETKLTIDGLESEVVVIGRSASRTKGDDHVLGLETEYGKALQVTKYFRLKAFWAKGLSANATAKALRGERGFGQRTLDLYWAAFAAAQKFDTNRGVRTPSPTVLEW